MTVVGAAGAIGVLGTRRLLSAQARAARAAIGKPLGEDAFHPDRTYRRKHGRPLTLLMLGDSIAAGLGAARPRHTLGVQLAKQLGTVSGRAVRLVPGAQVGAETSWLAQQIAASVGEPPPDVAVIVVGGNDVTHRVPLAESIADLEDAIRSLRSRGTSVVVGTCPDLGSLGAVPQPLRRLAGQASRRLAFAQRDATIRSGGYAVSLSSVVGADFVAEPDEMFALDRFHPSDRGYRAIAAAMLPSVLASLELSSELPSGHHAPSASGTRARWWRGDTSAC
ncbi:MAG TPA: SGNH/GDSL hydrolase family protein [Nocardioidaceae bacterium]|nr:SGNH/GDSL hydrolase family protein [Nocardioidaceae bacterium]